MDNYEKILEKYKHAEKKVQEKLEGFVEIELNERLTEDVYLEQINIFCAKDSYSSQLKMLFETIKKDSSHNNISNANQTLKSFYEELDELKLMLRNLSKNNLALSEPKKAEIKNALLEVHKELCSFNQSINAFDLFDKDLGKDLQILKERAQNFYQKHAELSLGIIKALETLYAKDLLPPSKEDRSGGLFRKFLNTW